MDIVSFSRCLLNHTACITRKQYSILQIQATSTNANDLEIEFFILCSCFLSGFLKHLQNSFKTKNMYQITIFKRVFRFMFVFFLSGFLKHLQNSFKTKNLYQITILKDLALTGSTFKLSLFDTDYQLLFIFLSSVRVQ